MCVGMIYVSYLDNLNFLSLIFLAIFYLVGERVDQHSICFNDFIFNAFSLGIREFLMQ